MTTLEDIADDLQREVAALADRAAARIYEELPDYVRVPRSELLESIRLNVNRGVHCLRVRAAPVSGTQPNEPQLTTRRRMDQGVPVEAIIRAYRLNLTAIHERFIHLAGSGGLAADETLLGSNVLWQVGDWFMDRAVREYRTHVVSDEIRRGVEKAAVLRAFGDPDADLAATLQRAEGLGLRPDGRYRVVMTCAAPHDDWVRSVERYGATAQSPAIAASLGAFAAGIVARDPGEAVHHGSVAAGSWESLADIGSSWRVAARVLPVAGTGADDHGWYDLPSLTWRIAVAGDDLVHAAVSEKYLRPLAGEQRFGRILLESVWAYLEHARNYRDASRTLVVHENTLRYRVQRFESLTAVSLDDLDTVVELAWLRESLRLRSGHHRAAVDVRAGTGDVTRSG